jgi:hypothetical protein
MSRQELAEAVNAWCVAHTHRAGALDEHYIGRLEQGRVRCPGRDYRAAFRSQYLGWLAIPLGRWTESRHHLDRAAMLALEVDDPLRLSTALSFQAYAALRTGDYRRADALSEASARDARIDVGLGTYLAFQRAEVLARSGDRAGAVRLLADADRLVEALPPAEELTASGYWYTPAFFLGQRGFVLSALGDTLAAMPPEWAASEWAARRRELAEV